MVAAKVIITNPLSPGSTNSSIQPASTLNSTNTGSATINNTSNIYIYGTADKSNSNDFPYSKKNALSFGWNKTITNLGLLLLFSIAVIVVNYIPSIISFFFPSNFINIIFGIIFSIVTVVLLITFTKVALLLTDNKKIELLNSIKNYKLFFKVIAATFIYQILITGGCLFFFIPGIIWSYEYQYYVFFLIDKDTGIFDAFRKSEDITKGKKFDLFLFSIICVLVAITGALLLVIGIFIAFPVILIAYAYIYRSLQTEKIPSDSVLEGTTFAWYKIIALIAGAVFFFIEIMYLFFPQILISSFYTFVWSKSQKPNLYQLPVKINIPKFTSSAELNNFSYEGITFLIPWHTVNNVVQNKDRSIRISTQDGNSLIFLGKQPKLKSLNISQYNLFNMILNVSPDQVNYFSTPEAAFKNIYLNIYKSQILKSNLNVSCTTQSFSSNNIKGFEYSCTNNSSVPKAIIIDIFDKSDNRYRLSIVGPTINQSDINLILSTINSGDFNTQDKIFNAYISAAKNQWEARSYRGSLRASNFAVAGSYRSSITASNFAVIEAGNPVEASLAEYWLGLGYSGLNLFDMATTHEMNAVTLNPKLGVAYSALSGINLEEKNYQQALDYANKSAQIDPTSYWAYNNMGRALMALGKVSEGIAAEQKAAQLDPSNSMLRSNFNVEYYNR